MHFYPENYTVTLSVPFSDPTGTPVTPAAATAKLLDGDGVEIVVLGNVTIAPAATSAEVVIPGEHNVLAEGETRAVRILVVTMTLPGGDIERRYSYAVEATKRIAVMHNSFMTYETAQVMASDFVNTAGWDMASEDARKTALVEAHRSLTSIPMRYNPVDETGKIQRQEEEVILRDEWIDLGFDDFAAWPRDFRAALRRAQFIETNALLNGDKIAEKRKAGILSESIGESSVRISGGIVDYGVDSETLSALTGYVYFSMRIGRA